MRLSLIIALLFPLSVLAQPEENLLLITSSLAEHTDTFHLEKIKRNHYAVAQISPVEILLPAETTPARYAEPETLKIFDPLTFVNVDVIMPGFLKVIQAAASLGETDSAAIDAGQMRLFISGSRYCIERIEGYRVQRGTVHKVIIENHLGAGYSPVCDVFEYLPIKKEDEFFLTACSGFCTDIGTRATVELRLYFKIK